MLGYGKEWNVLRENSKEPPSDLYAVEFAEVTGQDNWNLVHCKPWYRYHSYEWGPRVFEVTGKKNNKTVELMINEDGYIIKK